MSQRKDRQSLARFQRWWFRRIGTRCDSVAAAAIGCGVRSVADHDGVPSVACFSPQFKGGPIVAATIWRAGFATAPNRVNTEYPLNLL